MASAEKANAYMSTDDITGNKQHSKSFGPTNFTSQMTNAMNNSFNYNSIQFPTISNSRCQQYNDMHSNLLHGPIQKQFIKQNKQQLQRLLRQQMRSVEPFKGYLEISNATQHLKKHQHQQQLEMSAMLEPSIEQHESPNQRAGTPQPGHPRYRGQKNNANPEALGISSKVMETWINETLADAEHLDIPGVILKPEHKNPISRYSIDRMTLTNAGVPNEVVDRIYRCLFVYSVGFYELIKKILSHCNKKYSIITSIWKVFSVMLEYCCQSDYRLLISDITNQHKEEVENMEKEYQMKCEEFLNNEKILKQNMEVMQKYSEELEKERTNERTLRLKLEEEYMQNSKNHEEEVQLRLKFESKLNSMHSMHRELDIKHKRVLQELANAQQTIKRQEKLIDEQSAEILKVKTKNTEQEARIELLDEKKNTLERDVTIKNKLIADIENKMKKTQDESDLMKYQVHEQNKLMTEQRLKMDCLETKIEGLKNEKTHLEINLHETKEFKQIFEERNSQMKDKYVILMEEYNENKQKLIGFEELLKEKDDRIILLKEQTTQLTQQVFELDKENSTLKIELDKFTEYYNHTKKDLDDAIDRLHQTNRVRHELELRLQTEKETTEELRGIIQEKVTMINERDSKINNLEDRCNFQQMKMTQQETQIESLERQLELQVSALNEKNEVLQALMKNEKEARELWADRYEKEQKDHTSTNTEMLILKSMIKDLQLDLGNLNIKLESQLQQNAQLTDANNRLQLTLNSTLVEVENLNRESLTLKESLRQFKQTKKVYIQKLTDEMSLMRIHFECEEKNLQMQIEDYLSQGAHVSREFLRTDMDLRIVSEELNKKTEALNCESEDNNRMQMVIEDLSAQVFKVAIMQQRQMYENDDFQQQLIMEQKVRENLKKDTGIRINTLEREKEILLNEYQENQARWEEERERLYSENNELKQLQMSNSRNSAVQSIGNTAKHSKTNSITAGLQGTFTQMVAKTAMKNQEIQTLPVNFASQALSGGISSSKIPSPMVDQKVMDNGDQSRIRNDSAPNNKLVNEAAKRRDSMNRKLKEQEQLVQQMKNNASRRNEVISQIEQQQQDVSRNQNLQPSLSQNSNKVNNNNNNNNQSRNILNSQQNSSFEHKSINANTLVGKHNQHQNQQQPLQSIVIKEESYGAIITHKPRQQQQQQSNGNQNHSQQIFVKQPTNKKDDDSKNTTLYKDHGDPLQKNAEDAYNLESINRNDIKAQNSSISSTQQISVKNSRRGSQVQSSRYLPQQSKNDHYLYATQVEKIKIQDRLAGIQSKADQYSNDIHEMGAAANQQHNSSFDRFADMQQQKQRESIKLSYDHNRELPLENKPDSRQLNLSSKYESLKMSIDEDFKSMESQGRVETCTLEQDNSAQQLLPGDFAATPHQNFHTNKNSAFQAQANSIQAQRQQQNMSTLSNKKVVGNSSIKSMIRAAATRD